MIAGCPRLLAALTLTGLILPGGGCSSDGDAPPFLDPGPIRDGGAGRDADHDAEDEAASGTADAASGDGAPGDVADGAGGDTRPADATPDGPANDATLGTGGAGPGSDAATDGAAACGVPGSCDPLGANTCPGGQACRLASGQAACAAIAGTAIAAGQACQVSEQCDHGLVCINLGEGARCTALCRAGSQGTCGDGAACSLELLGQSCARLCAPLARPCDIYSASGCAAGQKCGLARNPESGARYTGCIPAGPGQIGTLCTADGQCAPGTICVGTGTGESRCHQVCAPGGGAPACLVSGQTCSGTSMLWNVAYCR